MSLNMLIISSILTVSLMQMEWKRIKALAPLHKKKKNHSEPRHFPKEKNWYPVFTDAFSIYDESKRGLWLKNLIHPILDKSNFYYIHEVLSLSSLDVSVKHLPTSNCLHVPQNSTSAEKQASTALKNYPSIHFKNVAKAYKAECLVNVK